MAKLNAVPDAEKRIIDNSGEFFNAPTIIESILEMIRLVSAASWIFCFSSVVNIIVVGGLNMFVHNQGASKEEYFPAMRH